MSRCVAVFVVAAVVFSRTARLPGTYTNVGLGYPQGRCHSRRNRRSEATREGPGRQDHSRVQSHQGFRVSRKQFTYSHLARARGPAAMRRLDHINKRTNSQQGRVPRRLSQCVSITQARQSRRARSRSEDAVSSGASLRCARATEMVLMEDRRSWLTASRDEGQTHTTHTYTRPHASCGGNT